MDMISYFLQVGTAWCIFIFIYQLMLRKEKFFTLNRWYLMGSILIGLLLPLASYLPSAFEEVTPAIIPEISSVYHSQIDFVSENSNIQYHEIIEPSSTWSLSAILFLIYGLGVLVMMIRGSLAGYRLINTIRKGETSNHGDFIQINLEGNQLPFSFFNYVCLGNFTSDDKLKDKILSHELHHIKSWHSVDVLVVEMIKILFWWNPLIYIFKKFVIENHEFSADAKVVEIFSRKGYCQLLLQTTFPDVNLPLSNPFFQSFIKKRINMMYQKESNKINLIKYSSAIVAFVFLMALFTKPITGQKIVWDKDSSVIQLGNDVYDGEVKVSIDNNKLTEGEDYKLNRETGKLSLIDNEKTQMPKPVKVEFIEQKETIKERSTTDKTSFECLKREDGVYFRTDIGPSVEGCESADRGDEPYSCAMSELGKFARSIKQYPPEALKEGFQGTVSYSLIINENGELVSWEQPKNMTRKDFGIPEECERIIVEIKRNFKFKPAICNEKNVKSRIPFSFRFEIGEEQMPLVEVKNIKTIKQPFQSITLHNISQKGSLGFQYNSNMNVPSEITIINPSGDVVFQKSYTYMYKRVWDSCTLDTRINGKYTIKAIQDGSEITSDVEVKVFKD